MLLDTVYNFLLTQKNTVLYCVGPVIEDNTCISVTASFFLAVTTEKVRSKNYFTGESCKLRRSTKTSPQNTTNIDHGTNKVVIKLLIRLQLQNLSFTEGQHSYLKFLERQERTPLTHKCSSPVVLWVFLQIFGDPSVREIYMCVQSCTCKYPCSCTGKVEHRDLSGLFLGVQGHRNSIKNTYILSWDKFPIPSQICVKQSFCFREATILGFFNVWDLWKFEICDHMIILITKPSRLQAKRAIQQSLPPSSIGYTFLPDWTSVAKLQKKGCASFVNQWKHSATLQWKQDTQFKLTFFWITLFPF